MTLQERITALATIVAGDTKILLGATGNLSTLQTNAKNSLVAAINELKGLIGTGGASAVIDDAATSSSTKTYSVDKILEVAGQVKQDLLGGVPSAAFDTLKEIADYILEDQTAASQIVSALAKRVRVDVAQTFTSEEKIIGRSNIGAFGTQEIGDPDTDFVTIYNTAKQ